MKKLLLIALLIVGCVFADIDSTLTINAEILPEYKYRFLIGTYPVWHDKNITGVNNPINFMFNFRIDKPFGFGIEYLKYESTYGEEWNTVDETWKHIIPSFSYEVKTDSDRFILELIMGAELTSVKWEWKEYTDNQSEWSGIFGCRFFYNINNDFYIGMLVMFREYWDVLGYSDGNTVIVGERIGIRPDFGIYYIF